MKYQQGQKIVDAIYDKERSNPYLDAMPDLLPREQFLQMVQSFTALPHNLPELTPEQRRMELQAVQGIFVPLDYSYLLYDALYRACRSSYQCKSTVDEVRATNSIFAGHDAGVSFATSPASGAILGVPGVGKTNCVRRCLATMPQVITHTNWHGTKFLAKQVLYLLIECPADCSIKTLGYSIIAAINAAAGIDIKPSTSANNSTIVTQIKILCLTYHVGLIVVDEIQNVVQTSKKSNQTKALLRFLLELTNDTATAVMFVGTPQAEELFQRQEHLKRRTRGLRLLPFKPDGTYLRFLTAFWRYQYTYQQAELTDSISNKLYDLSGGIPAYIVKLFSEAQAYCLLDGVGCINEKVLQHVADILAIKVPRHYSGGTYISDFAPCGPTEIPEPQEQDEVSQKMVPRLYANKRGRKTVQRDDGDLIVMARQSLTLQVLYKAGLVEVWND